MEYVMSDSQKPAELFRRSLDAFLAKDMRAWADLCAEDVLVEFPFAPAGTPSRLDGRVAIFEYLRNYPKIIDVHEIDSLEIYPTDRPDTVIGEWSVKGHVIPNGNAYNMSYATFVTSEMAASSTTANTGTRSRWHRHWGTCRSSRKILSQPAEGTPDLAQRNRVYQVTAVLPTPLHPGRP
jgi:ketosteroid isomerase-like protein